MSNVQQRINELENIIRKKNQTLNALGQDSSGLGIIKDFFIYQEDFTFLSDGDSDTATINIQADSDFVLQKMTYAAYISDAAQTQNSRVIPLCTVQITDTGSGRNLMENPCPIPSIFGTGEIPFILPTPKLFLARSNITLTVANFSSNTTYSSVRLTLIGHKVFRGLVD